MDRRNRIFERLIADLPGESLPGQTVVELSDDRRALIENHNGISEYGRDKICVRVRYGRVEIRGCGLEIAKMTREQVVIMGRIQSIALHRRGT